MSLLQVLSFDSLFYFYCFVLFSCFYIGIPDPGIEPLLHRSIFTKRLSFYSFNFYWKIFFKEFSGSSNLPCICFLSPVVIGAGINMAH